MSLQTSRQTRALMRLPRDEPALSRDRLDCTILQAGEQSESRSQAVINSRSWDEKLNNRRVARPAEHSHLHNLSSWATQNASAYRHVEEIGC